MKRAIVAVAFLCASAVFPAVVYVQPHDGSGTLYQSSWWDPNGSDYDQYVWDDFTLSAPQSITEIRWRGGHDPSRFGSGGAVIEFQVSIVASIAAGTQPDVIGPPLVTYFTGNNANEAPAGTFGGTPLYDYAYTLPTPFAAAAATKYWVQIEATQHGIPDWGIAVGANGTGRYFRRTAGLLGDISYQAPPGDACFTILTADAQPVGDTNGDGILSPADALYFVNFLFAGGPPPVGSADVDGDGNVAIDDLFYLVNFLFAGGAAPA